jgi:hypothetical protein
MKIEKFENKVMELINKKTSAVYDFEFIKALRKMPWEKWFESENTFRIRPQYLDMIHHWVLSSKLNQVVGLDRFTQRHLINGTTQTFDESYHRHAEKRLRFFRGEYAYHRRSFANCKFLEDEPLQKNDFVILSYPFCSTGQKHIEFEDLVSRCENLKIPVIVDCAYFGTCHGIHIDLTSPCIESVSFSLSKGIGLGDIRSGIRYSYFDDNFPIAQQNTYDHTVLAAAKIGIYMMEKFSPDFIPDKYLAAQLSVCHELGILATPCMHIALGDSKNWSEYIVDDKFYRIGIRQAVKARFKKQI